VKNNRGIRDFLDSRIQVSRYFVGYHEETLSYVEVEEGSRKVEEYIT